MTNGYMKKIVNVKLGKHVKIFDFVNLYGCKIGDNTKIGAFVEIQKGVIIGKNCKISSHSFICEGVIIEDNVFVGHNVTFINDKYPRAIDGKGRMIEDGGWKIEKTVVKKGASIGSSATILCGVRIGKHSIVGAGAVVSKNVPANSIVVGNPAKLVRKNIKL
ncbi:acetyltransferase [Candidatus Roizmanbacteria bacterium RIFCSPLOWO2_01_FULL_37_13]|uniref:Acetyltransferase n=1 Tax=Candidatus Roizmanbacteria bacterium RIFCSPHIGHO2_02_FULL_38_11 TaxID=1802039 RepID=A0A1F7H320_9BACT|nr:MAG: acetyltransferase [Candidatus Roizmanbacteria bacterium RIFCSPHIGHO2_02_FULL_38_11]OGK34271.1 MAG: acetyltransferase [Candidatus Roizmanbacteria bacterium RIFCSPHIGHO2_12_FULL_37_9b]OGK43059.1 MAG: acetyltransferase [Candidatus Roizmanbacteria bacterium RIFCSPLOWO2_01_FULL_37_13]